MFRDINTQTKLPPLSANDVTTYLNLFDQELTSKSKAMYQGKFLQSIRSATDGSDTYIRGRVSAEMIKKCVYTVDVKLDKLGVIMESQCECAVGMGPEAHCIHVGLVLYALTHAGDGIITKETCTQVLQTFYQCKKYTGSPVKMNNLILRDSDALNSLKNFDPHPDNMRSRVEYEDEFRSVWLNSTVKDAPIRQLYRPTNIYGVANDHTYPAKSPEDAFLEAVGVKDLSPTSRTAIEQRTRGQSKNKQWKEERAFRLHASDFGRVCKRTARTDSDKLARVLTTDRWVDIVPILEFVSTRAKWC